jgi:mRNA-degrading endonuclease YafQ of YafQ-DinJ toxin-antitoxin module
VRKWTVEVTKEAKAELLDLLKKKILTNADVKVLLKWVYEMEEFGPTYIAESYEWHDHELFREWSGFRSSAFSSKGRVIYKIHENKILIEVYKVTTDHNYKK